MEAEEIPEGVYVLQQRYVPHDWLFRQCAAVVHHGGAGDLTILPLIFLTENNHPCVACVQSAPSGAVRRHGTDRTLPF